MALQSGGQTPGFLEVLPGISNPFLEPAHKWTTHGPIPDGDFGTCGRTLVMNERPNPDIDEVRRAMREHDERVEQDEERDDEREEDEDGGQDDE
jgi:hypothetical protein